MVSKLNTYCLEEIDYVIGKHYYYWTAILMTNQFVVVGQMDALLSPSSKSYYACVGESTHAYQSPSKDLTAINNRLNWYIFDY